MDRLVFLSVWQGNMLILSVGLRHAEAKTFLEWRADFGAATISDASAFLEGSCAQRVVGTGDL